MGWINHVRRWTRFPINLVSNRLAPPVLILLYHRVWETNHDPQRLCVSPYRFRAQLDWIRRLYPIVAFDADWSKINEPTVAITFDDGYADNYLQALPILEELNIPATFFVTSGAIGTRREFWWDVLEHLLVPPPLAPPILEIEYNGKKIRWSTATSKQRHHAYHELHRLLRPLDSLPREQILAGVRSWARLPSDGRVTHRAISISELRELARSPYATIGAHTVTHTVLSTLAPDKQRQEISQSRMALEELTGQSVTVFAYPFGGRRDYNQDSVRICRELGFLRSAVNVPGQYRPWTDSMQVPRQLVRDWETNQFSRWIRWAWTRCS